jgi:hypothetical protein
VTRAAAACKEKAAVTEATLPLAEILSSADFLGADISPSESDLSADIYRLVFCPIHCNCNVMKYRSIKKSVCT